MTTQSPSQRVRARVLTVGGLSLGAVAVIASINLWDPKVVAILHAAVVPSVTAVAAAISAIGVPVPYFLAGGLGFIYFHFERIDRVRTNISLFIFLSSTNAALCADLLKIVFGRSRPDLLLERSIYAFHPFSNRVDFSSFPSEHAAVAAAMATALSMLMPIYRPTFMLLAVLVAISRIVVGAHYPSDVVAGMLLGIAVVLVLKRIFAHYGLALRREKPSRP